MTLSRTISTQLSRPLAFLAMVVAIGVVVSGNTVQAGVILQWGGDSSTTSIDLTAAGCGALAEPGLPAGGDPAVDDEENSDREASVVGLLGTGGGAAGPVDCASGQAGWLPAAMFQLPGVAQSLACASRHVRERSLPLSQPPRGELLDPPKG